MARRIEGAPKRAKQHTIYKTRDGIRVPGVTTILGMIAKPALKYWANDLGLQGIKVREYVDHLADIGTLAHKMIECHIKGDTPNTSDYSKTQIDMAENSVLKYFEWEKEVNPVYIESELKLVSEQYRYGGTCDIYCEIGGKKTLIDIKTSKECYPEHKTQVAAYWLLMKEAGYSVERAMIIRLGRTEDEGSQAYPVDKVMERQEYFVKLIELYGLAKKIK